jgi:uncharacterized protein YeaO (DUF488 family)
MNLRVKRIYDEPDERDGLRVLVDRVWPRGVSKASARVDRWMQEVAPSTDLRKWFGHDPARWDAFRERYAGELEEHPGALAELAQAASRGPVTLLYAARDGAHNNAIALREHLLQRLSGA